MIFLRWPEVFKQTAISKSAFTRGVKKGIYPAPIRIAPRTVVWKSTDIEALMQRLEENQFPAVPVGTPAQ